MRLGLSFFAILVVVLLTEVALRVGFGFGRPPLYVADPTMGYRLAPNQQIRRFGNRISINQYSMRASEISPLPEPDQLRLFLLGDSLANGNWWTDQANILSALTAWKLQRSLPKKYTEKYTTVEPLNASANSWGPRNQLAYLRQYGTFGATVLVLLLNTDDLFGTQPTDLQVGRDRNYPDRNPPSALAELLERLFKKQVSIPGLEDIQNEGGDRVGKNLNAIDLIYQKAVTEQARFLLVLSPLKREIPGPRDYEIIARQRLQDWTIEQNISYVNLLSTFQNHPNADALYRDHIHLSPAGNQLVSDIIVTEMISLLRSTQELTPTQKSTQH
ncbi:SGNH/GDSL hydrolase family protein [cf. Phormidesmis sp. LEGE 11477]|uniref:SGNH/GDSL hydrolase family protein n=1 Tax=cf. Phormidesmis sp. LEGE 11477 TaxID=1828680 RepID=UPI00187F1508|nr:SGNH/GDSL hydrolase family protein [cf. Phormidesmis sp. LEGE 11477]MBE9064174.1 SGNH/GDSL hydrolase family protein [cf. Phormidesmis sp. LEGE 11477]